MVGLFFWLWSDWEPEIAHLSLEVSDRVQRLSGKKQSPFSSVPHPKSSTRTENWANPEIMNHERDIFGYLSSILTLQSRDGAVFLRSHRTLTQPDQIRKPDRCTTCWTGIRFCLMRNKRLELVIRFSGNYAKTDCLVKTHKPKICPKHSGSKRNKHRY